MKDYTISKCGVNQWEEEGFGEQVREIPEFMELHYKIKKVSKTMEREREREF